MIDAVDAPFETKDLLKARGYRWNGKERHWSKEVPGSAFDDEYEWVVVQIYGGRSKPRFRSVTWCERHSTND